MSGLESDDEQLRRLLRAKYGDNLKISNASDGNVLAIVGSSEQSATPRRSQSPPSVRRTAATRTAAEITQTTGPHHPSSHTGSKWPSGSLASVSKSKEKESLRESLPDVTHVTSNRPAVVLSEKQWPSASSRSAFTLKTSAKGDSTASIGAVDIVKNVSTPSPSWPPASSAFAFASRPKDTSDTVTDNFAKDAITSQKGWPPASSSFSLISKSGRTGISDPFKNFIIDHSKKPSSFTKPSPPSLSISANAKEAECSADVHLTVAGELEHEDLTRPLLLSSQKTDNIDSIQPRGNAIPIQYIEVKDGSIRSEAPAKALDSDSQSLGVIKKVPLFNDIQPKAFTKDNQMSSNVQYESPSSVAQYHSQIDPRGMSNIESTKVETLDQFASGPCDEEAGLLEYINHSDDVNPDTSVIGGIHVEAALSNDRLDIESPIPISNNSSITHDCQATTPLPQLNHIPDATCSRTSVPEPVPEDSVAVDEGVKYHVFSESAPLPYANFQGIVRVPYTSAKIPISVRVENGQISSHDKDSAKRILVYEFPKSFIDAVFEQGRNNGLRMYYVIKAGIRLGVFRSWNTARASVDHISRVSHGKKKSWSEVQQYLNTVETVNEYPDERHSFVWP